MKIFAIAFAAMTVLSSPSSALAASPSPKLEVKYFGLRGAAETARIILALADQDYTDTRYEMTPGTFEAPEFKKAKESGDLDMNMGRAPLLVVDGKTTIGQSKAIERFLAKTFGLMGESDIEAAQIDCIAEHCRDIKDTQMKKGFSAFSRDKTEEEKAEARKGWFENDMPTMLEKLEKAVKLTSQKDSYAVGDKNSYADVVIFSLLKDCYDKEDTEEAAKDCSMLLAIAERIAKDSNVSKWVKERPKSMF